MKAALLRHPAAIAGVTVLLFALDVVTGPYIQFPITFVIPVSMTAWWAGRNWGVGLALAMSLARYVALDVHDLDQLGQSGIAAINALIRAAVLVIIAWLVARVARQLQLLSRRVETLEGILPICAFCKKIRNDAGKWEPVETYITEHTQAKFTHGFCEACAREHYPEVFGAGAPRPGSASGPTNEAQ